LALSSPLEETFWILSPLTD